MPGAKGLQLQLQSYLEKWGESPGFLLLYCLQSPEVSKLTLAFLGSSMCSQDIMFTFLEWRRYRHRAHLNSLPPSLPPLSLHLPICFLFEKCFPPYFLLSFILLFSSVLGFQHRRKTMIFKIVPLIRFTYHDSLKVHPFCNSGDSASSFFVAEECSVVCTYHIYFMPSSVAAHVVCFSGLALLNLCTVSMVFVLVCR